MNEKNSQSIKSDRVSESSIARMAGNIAAGFCGGIAGVTAYREQEGDWIAKESVRLARMIAAEIQKADGSERT